MTKIVVARTLLGRPCASVHASTQVNNSYFMRYLATMMGGAAIISAEQVYSTVADGK